MTPRATPRRRSRDPFDDDGSDLFPMPPQPAAAQAAILPVPITPPPHLSEPARVLFEETVAQLAKHGLAESADAVRIENYCGAVLRLRGLQAAIDEHGVCNDEGEPSPLLGLTASASRVVALLGTGLGLGRVPRARAAVVVAASEPKPITPAAPQPEAPQGDALRDLLRDAPHATVN